jgi:predicted phage gp36 major capsid-like protein
MTPSRRLRKLPVRYVRFELGVLRDPYTAAGIGQVKLWGRKRVRGGVTLGEAIAKLLIAA